MATFSLIRTSDASVEPVSLAEAKAFLRVDHDDEDELIASLITAARQWAEEYTGRGFIEQTWVMTRDRLRCSVVELPRAPLMAVSGINYLDASGGSHTVSAATYRVDTSSAPGRVEFTTLPPAANRIGAIAITYQVGYGATACDVPEAIRTAIKFALSGFYDRRSADVSIIPVAARNLLNPFRIFTF